MISVIQVAFEEREYTTYFYCLGMIAPMVHNTDFLSGNAKNKKNEWVKSQEEVVHDFIKHKYVEILLSHLVDFHKR